MEPILRAASSLIYEFLDTKSVFNLVRVGQFSNITGAFSPSANTFKSYRMRIRMDSSFSTTRLSTRVGIIPLSITLSIPKRNSARFIKPV